MASAKLRYETEVGTAIKLFIHLQAHPDPLAVGRINIKDSWRHSGNTGTQLNDTLKRLEGSVDDRVGPDSCGLNGR